MEAKKNLCGMIPEELHARAVAEKEQLGLKTLGEYVELILKEHFKGGGITMAETKTLAFKITEELDPGADSDRNFYPAGVHGGLCLPQHPL